MQLSPEVVKPSEIFRKAIQAALKLDTDRKKFEALQTVFGKFGYYFPSRILLGRWMPIRRSSNDLISIGGILACRKGCPKIKDRNSVKNTRNTIYSTHDVAEDVASAVKNHIHWNIIGIISYLTIIIAKHIVIRW